jgi:dTDP-4-amino-4,6-dideoxygalactose transaminase
MLRDHGQSQKYFHDLEGYNGRLDAIQAGILRVKLARLAGWNQERREAASRYRELFGATNASILPCEAAWAKAVYHLYVIRVQDRDGLVRHLADANIATGIHYPIPLHLQNAYTDLGYKAGDFPVAEKAAVEILSLPMYPGIEREQQNHVVQHTLAFPTSGPWLATTGTMSR